MIRSAGPKPKISVDQGLATSLIGSALIYVQKLLRKASSITASAIAPGSRLGPYEVVSTLGAGGMGEVYLALDTKLDRKVAIKVLQPDSLAEENLKKRLLREAQAAAKLDHPNICAVYDVNEADPLTFIVVSPSLTANGSTTASTVRPSSACCSTTATVIGWRSLRPDQFQVLDQAQAAGIGHWLHIVRAPPSGTWERRRAAPSSRDAASAIAPGA